MRNKGWDSSLMHMLATACQWDGGGGEGWSDYTTGLPDLGPLVTSLCLSFLNCEVGKLLHRVVMRFKIDCHV